jgi:hypothetical protein
VARWHVDTESFERVSQDEISRELLLRMAKLSREGRLAPLVLQLASDPDVDEETTRAVAELAADRRFLLAIENYLGRTRVAP